MPLQFIGSRKAWPPLSNFSPLVRGYASAIRLRARSRRPKAQISVPSFGAMPLQCAIGGRTPHATTNFSPLVRGYASAIELFGSRFLFQQLFQSPRSGLCLCNSSVARCVTPRRENFSPLVRGYASAIRQRVGEPNSARPISVPSFGAMPLQFLCETGACRLCILFQSPRSGLCLCNKMVTKHGILCGKFQSPRSGLCLCNDKRDSLGGYKCEISVPSFGAMPLQCFTGAPVIYNLFQISVPSFGAMPLQ